MHEVDARKHTEISRATRRRLACWISSCDTCQFGSFGFTHDTLLVFQICLVELGLLPFMTMQQ